jgi:hypothetical protein
MIIRTPAGAWIWGLQSFYWLFDALGSKTLSALLQAYYGVNGAVCLGGIALYAWLSRAGPRDARTLGRNVAASYFILYGFTNYWSFQYLAWSLPFWLLVGPAFAVAATAVLGGYVYGVYAHACGNPWLLGPWDFVGHPVWPLWLRGLRNAAVLFSLGSAIAFGVSAWRRRPRRTAAPTGDPSGPTPPESAEADVR